MADYKERFDKWQKDAKEKFEEIDKQLGIKETIEEGAKVVRETAKKGAESAKKGAEKIKKEAERSETGKKAVKVAEETVKSAESAAKKAYDASKPIRDAAEDVSKNAGSTIYEASKSAENAFEAAASGAGEILRTAGKKANNVYEETRKSVGATANSVSKAFNFGASWTRTFNNSWKGLQKATDWMTENPMQAATTGFSLVVGAGAGVVFTGISSHWLFSSALPGSVVKRFGKEFTAYLDKQEKLIAEGKLTKAEQEKVEFERQIVKQVGAPLLGAFSFASGAVLMTNILNPKTITGAPIDWLIGGNPLLEGVWFFGNGMICFKTSYDFFMVALEDQEEVRNIVKEIKGLIPQTAQN